MAEVYVILVTDRRRMLQIGYDNLRIVYKTDIKIKRDEENVDGLNFLAGKTMDYVNKKAMQGTIEAHVSGGVTDIKINDRQGFLRGIKKSTKGQLNIISLHYEPEKHGMEMGKSVRPSAGAPPTRTK